MTGTDSTDRIQLAWARERPGTPVESIGVITRLWRVGKLLGDERRRTLHRIDIDRATLDLLSTLRRAGPPYRLAPSELAKRSLISAGAITQRVAKAEEQGLVLVERTESGRRTITVEPTSQGHALIERSVDDLLRHEESLIDHLDVEQRAQLAELLRILLAGLHDKLGVAEEGATTDAG
ncbi:MarR family winged helix-turn-helix transcriptional regulator [Actinoalloteichus hymeniacidonis]|uniref:Transcriptional regulator n=1 Tax=Actinoalloteichus hymeniacidonis TaxID=340345 RepID=A0AAC9N0N2_9PSEU|nr:MarR family transcriptional regulator [Actinoalloteichus hymeniacidonis]AOS65267.1 transcriptional regulator [Actinoalloteichus hymeniacidonis]MBB5906651.1 DNA-binding MarR family transcriptional regulator [Actinoalloteichus hymeniacidonis]